MSKTDSTTWLRKPEPGDVRGPCVQCGIKPQKKTSKGKYQALCSPCDNKRFRLKKEAYKDKKGECCERCGFVPEHSCQLDVDHDDGDHSNNDPSNLKTLCANCHRLKTHQQLWSKYTPRA